jgi:hypothetical protein
MIASVKRACSLAAGFLMFAAAACGQQSAAPATPAGAQSSPCPGPGPVATVQVTAMINPLPTSDPLAPADSIYALQVPGVTELLVVVADSNASSKDALVPTFEGPDGQIVTRGQLVRDEITGGNPGDLGVSELMQVQAPKSGAWVLRLHNTSGRQIVAHVNATAIFHLHRPPLATIDARPSSGPAPLTVTFDAGGTQLDGGSATYCWDFMDGVTERSVKVSHTFRKAGTYGVALTVTDDQGRQGYAGAQVTVTG